MRTHKLYTGIFAAVLMSSTSAFGQAPSDDKPPMGSSDPSGLKPPVDSAPVDAEVDPADRWVYNESFDSFTGQRTSGVATPGFYIFCEDDGELELIVRSQRHDHIQMTGTTAPMAYRIRVDGDEGDDVEIVSATATMQDPRTFFWTPDIPCPDNEFGQDCRTLNPQHTILTYTSGVLMVRLQTVSQGIYSFDVDLSGMSEVAIHNNLCGIADALGIEQ